MLLMVFIRYSLAFLVLFLIQTLLPGFYLGNYSYKPDLFLVFLTYIAIRHDRLTGTVVGFIIGLIMDIATQAALLGIYAFVKSISGYTLGTFHQYRTIWTRPIKLAFLFFCYLLHFSIFYYVTLNGTNASLALGAQLVFFHSLITLILVLVSDRFFFDFYLGRN